MRSLKSPSFPAASPGRSWASAGAAEVAGVPATGVPLAVVSPMGVRAAGTSAMVAAPGSSAAAAGISAVSSPVRLVVPNMSGSVAWWSGVSGLVTATASSCPAVSSQ